MSAVSKSTSMASRSSARVPQADKRSLTARELREKYNSYINADPALVESRRWIEVSKLSVRIRFAYDLFGAQSLIIFIRFLNF